MIMAMHLTGAVRTSRVFIVFTTMLVAVVSKMRSMSMRLFKNIANALRCHVGGIQRKHDGENKHETSAHGGGV